MAEVGFYGLRQLLNSAHQLFFAGRRQRAAMFDGIPIADHNILGDKLRLRRVLLRGVIQHDGFLDLLRAMRGYWGGFEKAGAVMLSPIFSLVQSRPFIYERVKVADLFCEE